MQSRVLIWAGMIFAIVGGILMFIYEAAHPGGPTAVGTAPSSQGIMHHPGWVGEHSLLVIALPMLLLAVTAIHRLQTSEENWWSVLALWAGLLGPAMQIAPIYADAYLFPTIARNSPGLLDNGTLFEGTPYNAYKTFFTIAGVGIFIFGIYVLTQRVLPWWIGVAFMAGSIPADVIQFYVATFTFYRVGTFIVGGTFIVTGLWVLARQTRTSAVAPAAPTAPTAPS